MMKILVLSDSHQRVGKVKKILKENRDVDAVIFLGDGEGDIEAADVLDLDKNTFIKVRGNCDRNSEREVSMCRGFEKINFYITHGNEQGVKYGIEKLAAIASNAGCKVALYGHTHRQHLTEFNGVTIFNPGAAANGEYGIITIIDGQILFEHKTLK